MAATDLLSRIRQNLPKVAEAFETDFRKELDKNIHILDLSYESLKVNVYSRKQLKGIELETYNRVHDTLYTVIKQACAGKTFVSLNDPNFLPMFNRAKSVGAILIDGGPNHVFLVGGSFDSIQKFASTYISRDPRLKATRFGSYTKFKQKVDSKGRPLPDEYTQVTRTKTDIGHISSEDNPNLVSPLEEKINTVLETASIAGNTRVVGLARTALKQLYSVQADIAYSFKNSTPENIALARKVLGTAYVVVTLHSEKLNNKFSSEEKKIYDRLLASVASSVGFASVRGSNSISEDIAQHIAYKIVGSNKKLKTHQKQSGKTSTKVKSRIKTTPTSLTLGIREIRQPAVQSLVGLEALLRAKLFLRVKENMGTGNAKNVLNYRTGRFAESATIERATISREGMVSVFYNYMRHPYGTFSEGGQQQYPKTRDPKTLISKSIREIGASIAFNRMRAVLV